MLTDEISTYVIIKEESDCDAESSLKLKTPEIAAKEIYIDIKIEPFEKNEIKEVDLYEDHKIKEEIVVGPVILQKSIPAPNVIDLVRGDRQPNRLPDKQFSSEICEKTYTKESTSLKHKLMHEIEFLCYLCSEQFQCESSYETHMLGHSNTKKLSCTICKKNYLYKKNLLWHLLNRHSRENTLSCRICNNRKFSQKTVLETHMLIHSEETFSCDLCKENYVRKSDLTIHLRKHVGGKSFSCKFCKKEFETHSGLECHERTHTGEKPFTCDICGASFARGSKLYRHMRQHSGTQPLKCDFCEKKFVRSADLQRHVLTHA